MLKTSASIYESSGFQFFRTTTGIQSRSNVFGKSKLVMIFLANTGLAAILCSFRLFLEGKSGKQVPELSRLEFFEMISEKRFALSDVKHGTSGPLKRGGMADLPLLRTLQLFIELHVSQVSGKRKTLLFFLYKELCQFQKLF